jgi:DNA (cytosine-5)-methyltransferase 1
MRVLSCFSGIGGLDLGLERAGMTVVAQSEVDPYASRVLRKHWPHVPNLGDISTITEDHLGPLGPIDLVCGGFPCQDISVAGDHAGIDAPRTGLFFQLMRVVRLVGPRFVLLENVPALLARADWMGAVLGELATCGFDAEWDCIPASAVGACHARDRVFVVAHVGRLGLVWGRPNTSGAEGFGPAGEEQLERLAVGAFRAGVPAGAFGRMHDGVSARVDRLRGLGNAVCPQVAEHVGRIIMEAVDAVD